MFLFHGKLQPGNKGIWERCAQLTMEYTSPSDLEVQFDDVNKSEEQGQ